VITRSVSANHLELESEDALELLRIARLLDVNVAGLCKVSVLFIREGLTDEICYENFQARARAEARERDAQLDFTQP